MKHKIKVITNLEPSQQEVEVKKLFTHMGFEFAYVMKPWTDRFSDRVWETRSIVEVTTGMALTLLVTSSSKTIKGYIEDFKNWMDIEVETPDVLQQELDRLPKINSNIKL
jgi:hypothetical protein